MTNKYWITLLLAGIAAYGCSDDSNDNNTDDHTTKTCQNNDECTPEVCVEGTCKPASDQTCTGDDCKQDQPVELDEGDDCVEGATDKICKSPLVCTNGKCKTKAAPQGESCSSDSDCTSKDADHQTCLPNGTCGKYLNKGDECDDDDASSLCSGDLKCYDLACKEVLSEGVTCGNDLDQICDPKQALECIHNVCRVKEINLSNGKACNDSYLLCAPDLTCYAANPDQPDDKKCVKLVKENDECDEANHILCDSNLYCRTLTTKNDTGATVTTQTCQPLGNACENSKDCTEKDSYCCTSEKNCSAVEYKHCIPFDESHNHDDACLFPTKPGIFEAQIQCRWQPTEYPDSPKVEMPPLVGPFGNKDGLKTVVAFYSYDKDGQKDNPNIVIRFINPKTCDTLESIKTTEWPLAPRWYHVPTSADLDNDGLMEFIAVSSTHVYIFKWNETNKKHEMWKSVEADLRSTPMVFDIDGDNVPEIVGPLGHVIKVKPDGTTQLLYNQDLYNDLDGASYSGTQYTHESGNDGALGYLLPDDFPGVAQLVTGEGLYTWNKTGSKWDKVVSFPNTKNDSSLRTWVRQFTAYADFGTPGSTADSFNFEKLDGKPEIVISGKNKMHIYAIVKNGTDFEAQSVTEVTGFSWGGPITIGDFNNDGLPEIAIASRGLFGVYDPKCTGYDAGKCADRNVLWERKSQDSSSGTTGSSLFDFDGDGQAEAVYADECYTRVYEGKTGKVLFSAKRSSNTSIEGPVIADIDEDGSAEILMGSDIEVSCANIDPIHEGIRCEADEDCPSQKNCNKTLKLCTCTTNDDCNTQFAPGKDTYLQQYECTDPIHPDVSMMVNTAGDGSPRSELKPANTRPDNWHDGDYKVCRATRKTADIGVGDLMIYKDRLDRWVSARNIWNQYAYNIINIKDNGQVPNTADWLKTFTETLLDQYIEGTTDPRPKYNNYRLNAEGEYGAGSAPDITGRFITESVCGTTTNKEGKRIHVISGKLCNRGTKPVGYNLPATFFYYKEDGDHHGEKICTSYTDFNVGKGECYQVGCELPDEDFEKIIGKKVLMVSNLDEHGSPSTIECNETNNTDTIVVERCDSDIVIDN